MSERSDRSRSSENRRRDSRGRGSRRRRGPESNEAPARSRSDSADSNSSPERTAPNRASTAGDSADTSRGGPILSSLQIGSPLDEFRSHFTKKQRSFEGAASPRAAEIYKRAFELAEELIRKQRGGGDRC